MTRCRVLWQIQTMATLNAWQVAKEHAESETGTVARVVEAAQNAAGVVDNKAHQAVATAGKTAQQAKQRMCNALSPLHVSLMLCLVSIAKLHNITGAHLHVRLQVCLLKVALGNHFEA